MLEAKAALYQALLGSQKSLDEALNEASQNIADIGWNNTIFVRRAVRRDGVSSTKLYDLPTHQQYKVAAD
jgi:hypothetical protein